MKILNAAKAMLVERTIQYFTDMRENLELTPSDYKDHFSSMGEIILQIDTYESFADICKELETGEWFQTIGYFPDDEDMMEEFLEDVRKTFLAK